MFVHEVQENLKISGHSVYAFLVQCSLVHRLQFFSETEWVTVVLHSELAISITDTCLPFPILLVCGKSFRK
jgi:hypothetical protein